MAERPKALLLGEIDNDHSKDAWQSLGDIADLITTKATNREEFLQACKAGDFDGVVAIYRQLWSTSITGVWDDELVAALPESMKLVANCGAGYDALRPDALSKREILATNVTDPVCDATADTALFLIIGALRNFNNGMFALRRGEWRGTPTPALGHDPQGKLLGILGMGGIGRNLAHKCRAIGMRVQYYNRSRLSHALEEGAEYVTFDELLATSDVIVVSVPLNAHTRHLISAAELAKCKKGVVIINTARGPVVDEAALVEALDRGHVATVGLDVFEDEPEVHEGLVRNLNAVLVPHMGTWTVETLGKMEEWNIENVRRALEWFSRGKREEGERLSVIPEQKDLWKNMLAR